MQAVGGSSRIHYVIVRGYGKLARDLSGDTSFFGDLQFVPVATELMDARTRYLQDLCDQKSQLAIAEHGNGLPFLNLDLIEDLARCTDRFHKDGMLVWYGIREDMQVPLRQSEHLAKRAGMLHDAEHSARRAMASESTTAPGTFSARKIDLAYDSLAYQIHVIGIDHLAYKLVARRPREAVVSTLEFQVRVADTA
jgi:hypothetical protein